MAAGRLARLPDVMDKLVATADRRTARQFGLALLIVIAGGLLSGITPLALQNVVDAVASYSRHETEAKPLLTSATAYLLALGGSRLLAEIRPFIAGIAEQRLYARLRLAFFDELLRLRPASLRGRTTGALGQCLQEAMTGYQLVVMHLVGSVVPVLVEVGTVIVVIIRLGQPSLTAAFAITALAYITASAFGARPLRARALAVSDAHLEMHGALSDGLLNVETVKSFNAESTTCEQLSRRTRILEDRWRCLLRDRGYIGTVLAAAFVASSTASLFLSAEAVARGTLSVGGFVLANVCVLQVARPLETLGTAVRDLSQALAFIAPLLDLLQAPKEAPSAAETASKRHDCASESAIAASAASRPPAIRFRDVHFAYGAGPPVLNGIDLDLEPGRSVAIVGPSGSGKSSLARLLLRLDDPTSGSILIDDTLTTAVPAASMRALIGLVPQDISLLNDTIAANIELGRPGATRSAIEQASRIACLHDFVTSLSHGYDTRVSERGLSLSGGERQRVAIARAILRQPAIYIFDEATSMLDSRTEAAILDGLRHTTASSTVITIAHRLTTVRHAEEILVLDEGRLVERGRHAALLARGGLYARLWRSQRCSDSA